MPAYTLPSAERFWAIKHADSDLYFADCGGARDWTSDYNFAQRYSTEDAAMSVMVDRWNGKGQAVEIVIPSARGPYGPPRGAYAPGALDAFKL